VRDALFLEPTDLIRWPLVPGQRHQLGGIEEGAHGVVFEMGRRLIYSSAGRAREGATIDRAKRIGVAPREQFRARFSDAARSR